jgi:hypothetical protein
VARAGAASQTGTRRIISLSGATNSGSDAMTSFIIAMCRPFLTSCRTTRSCSSRCCAVYAENDKLRLLIQRFTRHESGRRSEQLTPDQLQSGLEDQEQTVAEHQAAQDAAEAAGGGQPKPRTTPRPTRNHGALPAHLPRYEVVIDVAHEACPCCGGGAFTSLMRVSRWAAAARFRRIVPSRRRLIDFGDVGAEHFAASRLHHGAKQIVLALEVPVESLDRHPGRRGDLVDRSLRIARIQKRL